MMIEKGSGPLAHGARGKRRASSFVLLKISPVCS